MGSGGWSGPARSLFRDTGGGCKRLQEVYEVFFFWSIDWLLPADVSSCRRAVARVFGQRKQNILEHVEN